jgi:CheY-like chemotaxis protein
LGFNSLLLARSADKPRATQVLSHTRQSADHLMTVINDVLDYSQFKSGQLRAQLATMPLRQVLQTAFDLFKPRINDSTVSYRLAIADDVPEWVSSDRHRLTQILVNLLGNAIKFTHQGEVSLQVQVIDEGVKFSVRDSGIGIPVDQQARLFERFNQADASIQRRVGGSGLGLTISQRLVQLLDGHMGFESTAGEGSVFWFWLPLRAVVSPAPSSTEPTQRLRSTAHGWHLLVVDDHPVNRLLLRQILQMTWPKASITEASNGEAALQLLSQQPFDLVLMDMVMPGMDGIETTRALHVQLAQADKTVPPVLGLTANVNPHDLQRFQDAGLKGILLKPFERDALVAQIDALLLA